MSTLNELIAPEHKINMDDIIREGNPTLREVAKVIEETIPAEYIELGKKMLEFLVNSQDPQIAEEMGLRGGVGLAAPQLDQSVRMTAVHVPSADPEQATPTFSDVLYNPKIIAHSVQDACLAEGEGCLSVDREVPGYVVRHNRITITYTNAAGEKQKVKLKGYDAIVVQHEIDHLNGVMFYDHINPNNPFAVKEGVLVIE
jgi:peptide deformylase